MFSFCLYRGLLKKPCLLISQHEVGHRIELAFGNSFILNGALLALHIGGEVQHVMNLLQPYRVARLIEINTRFLIIKQGDGGTLHAIIDRQFAWQLRGSSAPLKVMLTDLNTVFLQSISLMVHGTGAM